MSYEPAALLFWKFSWLVRNQSSNLTFFPAEQSFQFDYSINIFDPNFVESERNFGPESVAACGEIDVGDVYDDSSESQSWNSSDYASDYAYVTIGAANNSWAAVQYSRASNAWIQFRAGMIKP